MHQIASVRSLLLLLALLLVGLPLISHANPLPATEPSAAYTLASLRGGVQGFLDRKHSGLATAKVGDQSAAQTIENVASYYNVEPRIVLALIESTSGLITNPAAPDTLIQQPFGAGPLGFKQQIEWASRELRAGLGPYDQPPTLVFRDGNRRSIPLSEQPEAMTIKRLLAFDRTLADWERLIAAYPGIYATLFRDEPVEQAPTPIVNRGFLSEPWVRGTRVVHSSYFDHAYPMVDAGGDGNDMMVDYLGRSGLSYNSHDGHDYYFPEKPYGTPIVAAAPGWAFARTTRGLGVVIQHAGAAAGYETVYWHLEGFAPSFDQMIDAGNPRWVERGELLGWSGATGFTDGAPHLHFEVRHNGKQVDPYGWFGPGADPCIAYRACESSTWLWDASVSWRAPGAAPAIDTTPPTGLITLNPDPHMRLLAQFENHALSAVGPVPSAQGIAYGEGRWGQAVQVGRSDSLTYPASPTLNLAQGTFAMWVKVPEQWSDSVTGRHYLAAASVNPADPAQIYNGTWALRHEARGPAGTPVWSFWTVPMSGTADHDLLVPDTLAPGWHHFAVTWDAAQGRKALVIDGTQTAESENVDLPSDLGESLELGRWTIDAGESSLFIDDVLSYDRPLNAEELKALASASAPQPASAVRTDQRDLVILTPALDNGGGVVQVQLGLNGKYAAPLPYHRAYRWTLPAAEGQYMVNVRLKDRSGNTTTLTNTISVDHPPQTSLLLTNLTALTATLVLSATDANQPVEVAFSTTPNPVTKSWELMQAERIWHWTPMQPRRVYVWFRDATGHERGPFVAGPGKWQAFLPRISR